MRILNFASRYKILPYLWHHDNQFTCSHIWINLFLQPCLRFLITDGRTRWIQKVMCVCARVDREERKYALIKFMLQSSLCVFQIKCYTMCYFTTMLNRRRYCHHIGPILTWLTYLVSKQQRPTIYKLIQYNIILLFLLFLLDVIGNSWC